MGGVVGGLAGLAGVLLLTGLALWSWRTFSFRARKRLIEDQVYSIVIGAQASNVHTWGHHQQEKQEQVTPSSQSRDRAAIL